MKGVVGSNGTSCTMGFGESGSGLCPLTMMMPMPLPLVTSRFAGHDHHFNPIHNLNDCNADTHRSLLLLPSSNSSNDHNNQNNHNIQNISGTGLGSYFMENNNHNSSSACSSSVKAKIMAHPHYPRLLTAYASCQKVGAPPEVVAKLEEVSATMSGQAGAGCLGQDPALDQFMEAYSEMLIKYEQELSKPFKEAMLYFQRIECQFKALTLASPNSACNEVAGRAVSFEDDVDAHNHLIDPQAEDQEIKGKLLRKYSGYLGSLKQEFMKKRKKGKLPKEARQQLLEWWSRHYKWPYPSEPQKLALAESTGLDQKQINNWFINQRKRHWKPSEDMQFVVMDAAAHPHYYMDNVWGNPFPTDLSSALV